MPRSAMNGTEGNSMMNNDTAIDYTPAMDNQIRNLAALPSGTGANYLKCLIAHDGKYIAKSWHRNMPRNERGHITIRFAR